MEVAVDKNPAFGGRSWERWRSGLTDPRVRHGIKRIGRLAPRPLDFALRYFLARGAYPATIPIRTPTGVVRPTVWSFHDVQTVNEIFMREDYRAPQGIGVVVDLGSNIGLSALYFISRNPDVRCHLFEPVPRNVDRLRANLTGLEDRYELTVAAVADEAGEVTFGIEETGRYGGIDVETGNDIVVRCLEVNEVLAGVLEGCDRIDVLKVDTEGAEEPTLRAIRPDLLDRIDRIYFESHEPLPMHEDRFDFDYFNMTSVLVRRR